MQHPKFSYFICLNPVKSFLSKVLLGIIGLGLTACDSGFPDVRAIRANNVTSKKLKDQSTEESQQGYLEAMKYEPFQEEIHLNLGTTYDILKDQEKALRLYKNAEDFFSQRKPPIENSHLSFLNPSHPLEVLFAAYFNQAQLLARENKLDEALEKYQSALGVIPDSKEVKTNIELLFQRKQNQQGGGDSDNKDQNDQNQDQNGQSGKDNKDQKKDPSDGEDKKQDQKKDYSSSPKYKPREFKGELNKESVQKIFGEISQQEKKMRTQFSKQSQSKESPRDKDW